MDILRNHSEPTTELENAADQGMSVRHKEALQGELCGIVPATKKDQLQSLDATVCRFIPSSISTSQVEATDMFGLNPVISVSATPCGNKRDMSGKTVNTYNGKKHVVERQCEWLAFPESIAQNMKPLSTPATKFVKRDKLIKYNNVLTFAPKVVQPLEFAWKEAATTAHLALAVAKRANWDNSKEVDPDYVGNSTQVTYLESRQLAISALQTVALVSDVISTYNRDLSVLKAEALANKHECEEAKRKQEEEQHVNRSFGGADGGNGDFHTGVTRAVAVAPRPPTTEVVEAAETTVATGSNTTGMPEATTAATTGVVPETDGTDIRGATRATATGTASLGADPPPDPDPGPSTVETTTAGIGTTASISTAAEKARERARARAKASRTEPKHINGTKPAEHQHCRGLQSHITGQNDEANRPQETQGKLITANADSGQRFSPSLTRTTLRHDQELGEVHERTGVDATTSDGSQRMEEPLLSSRNTGVHSADGDHKTQGEAKQRCMHSRPMDQTRAQPWPTTTKTREQSLGARGGERSKAIPEVPTTPETDTSHVVRTKPPESAPGLHAQVDQRWDRSTDLRAETPRVPGRESLSLLHAVTANKEAWQRAVLRVQRRNSTGQVAPLCQRRRPQRTANVHVLQAHNPKADRRQGKTRNVGSKIGLNFSFPNHQRFRRTNGRNKVRLNFHQRPTLLQGRRSTTRSPSSTVRLPDDSKHVRHLARTINPRQALQSGDVGTVTGGSSHSHDLRRQHGAGILTSSSAARPPAASRPPHLLRLAPFVEEPGGGHHPDVVQSNERHRHVLQVDEEVPPSGEGKENAGSTINMHPAENDKSAIAFVTLGPNPVSSPGAVRGALVHGWDQNRSSSWATPVYGKWDRKLRPDSSTEPTDTHRTAFSVGGPVQVVPGQDLSSRAKGGIPPSIGFLGNRSGRSGVPRPASPSHRGDVGAFSTLLQKSLERRGRNDGGSLGDQSSNPSPPLGRRADSDRVGQRVRGLSSQQTRVDERKPEQPHACTAVDSQTTEPPVVCNVVRGQDLTGRHAVEESPTPSVRRLFEVGDFPATGVAPPVETSQAGGHIRLDGDVREHQSCAVRQPAVGPRSSLGGQHAPVVGDATATQATCVLRLPSPNARGGNANEDQNGESNSTAYPTSDNQNQSRGLGGDRDVRTSVLPLEQQNMSRPAVRPTNESTSVRDGQLGSNWRADLRRDLLVQGQQEEDVEAVIDCVQGNEHHIPHRVWNGFISHCKSRNMATTFSSSDEALIAIESYVIWMRSQKFSESKMGAHTSFLSKRFRQSHRLNINGSVAVKASKQQTHKDHTTRSNRAYSTSFHNGLVFHYIHVTLTSPEFRALPVHKQEELTRDFFSFALSEDACLRASDVVGLRLDGVCVTLLDKNKQLIQSLTLENVSNGAGLVEQAEYITLRPWDSKTGKGSHLHPRTIQRVRRSHVPSCKYTCTFNLFVRYLLACADKQHLRHEDDNHLLLQVPLCNRQPSSKLARDSCKGKCGKAHALGANTINTTRKSILMRAGIDVSIYKGHSCRGNAENAMMHGATVSSYPGYTADSILMRTGHSQVTFERNYKRPADAKFIFDLDKHTKKHSLRPEEVIRVYRNSPARATKRKRLASR